jgi:hypothetical protein
MMITSQPGMLLWAGLVAALLFFVVTTAEIFLRPGFSILRHAISVLSLGERGWLMVATFIFSGLLVVAFAWGVLQADGPWFGALLFALFGVGLVLAGVFPAPAGQGFPPGTPDDLMPVMDRGAVLHSVAFMVAFSSLIIASVFVGVHFWLAGSVALGVVLIVAGVLMPVLIGLGMASIVATGVAFYVATMIGWLVVVLVAMRLGSTA